MDNNNLYEYQISRFFMVNEYPKKIMVDACIFIKIILQENNFEECEDYIRSIVTRGDVICVTPGIIHEIVKKLEEKSEEEIVNLHPVRKIKEQKLKNDMLFSHLMALKGLLSEGEGKVLFMPNPHEGKKILDECMEIRLGRIDNSHWDRFHLAFAISNDCEEFVTTDSELFEAEKEVRGIARRNFKIILLGH